jgi:serine/threonine protein phosphatase PrpC
MNTTPAMRWSSASLTDAGTVHTVNQDACLDLPAIGLWVVADGVGGHNEGEIASQLIVETLSQTSGHARLSDFVNEVEDRLQEVHKTLVDRAASKNMKMIIGSTVAALLVVEQYGLCLWAGDSRIYRYRKGQIEQITRDHSQVEELVARGELQREEAENHPNANVITRAVGAGEELFLDAELQELCNADRYLICSDGLYKEVNDAEIAEHMKYGDCVTICRTLVALALERGANDNVTVMVIKFDAT